MPTDVLNAIGQLWKLVVAIAFPLGLFLFRAEIRELIGRITTIKYGDKELRTDDRNDDNQKDSAIQRYQEEEDVDINKGVTDENTSTGNTLEAMDSAFENSDFKTADVVYKNLVAQSQNEDERREIHSGYLYLRYTHAGDSEALEKLRKLSSQDPKNAVALFCLGSCYVYMREYPTARDKFTEARNYADEVYGAQITANIADCWLKEGQALRGLDEVVAKLRESQKAETKVKLYTSLGSMYQAIGSERMRSAALEKALEFAPNAADIRFDAAYSQSQAKFAALSATNYDTLLTLNPKQAAALNNLGVECSRGNLKFKSVDYFRKAEQEGNTLAMANLAQALMLSGFHEDAAEKLSVASQKTNPHENVALAHAELERKRQEENEKWADLIMKGTRQQQFLREFAQASIEFAATDPFLGTWQVSGGIVSPVTSDGNQIYIEFLYEGVRRKFEATRKNGSAEGKLLRWKVSLLETDGSYGDGPEALAAVGSDGKILSILELTPSSTLIRLTRIT